MTGAAAFAAPARATAAPARAPDEATDVLFLQRVVPHYRAPLFETLHRRHGALVATAAEPPPGTGLRLDAAEGAAWRRPAPMHFPDPGNPWRVTAPIGEILQTLRPRLVIAEFSLSAAWVPALIAARRFGSLPRLLFWSHGWNMSRGFRRPADLASQALRLPLLALADGHVAYCDAGARFAARALGRARSHTARNTQEIAVDPAALERSIAATETGARPFTAVCSGRLTPDKRVPALIRLFARVAEALPGARLEVIGDGEDRAEAERAAVLAPPGSVRLHGAVYAPERLAALMEGADVACYAGAAGLAVNHALAHALPFAARRRGPRGPFHHPEIAEVVPGESGVLADDDAGLAAALVGLGRDRARLAALRRSALARHQARLTAAAQADAFSAIIAATLPPAAVSR